MSPSLWVVSRRSRHKCQVRPIIITKAVLEVRADLVIFKLGCSRAHRSLKLITLCYMRVARYYLALGRGARHCDERACTSVCLQAYLTNKNLHFVKL